MERMLLVCLAFLYFLILWTSAAGACARGPGRPAAYRVRVNQGPGRRGAVVTDPRAALFDHHRLPAGVRPGPASLWKH